MIETDKVFSFEEGLIEYLGFKGPETFFFDIETTGLSPRNSEIYLIGVVYQKDGQWRFHQWFSEALRDEETLLRSFFSFIETFKTVIHFNGDTFDIKFIESTAKSYHIPCGLSEKRSVDLLKIARKIKKVLPLDSLRQKEIEKFLGIYREDPFTGGELIEVYEAYRDTHDKGLLKPLLLHNEEDLIGMPKLLPILLYYKLLKESGDFTVKNHYLNKSGTRLTIECETEKCFPGKAVGHTECGCLLSIEGLGFIVEIPLLQETLKSYLPHPEDYYYLPKEDMVVHKALASSVDPKYRVKATKEQCFVSFTGAFVPARKALNFTVFRKDLSDKKGYFPLNKIDLEGYVRAVFADLS